MLIADGPATPGATATASFDARVEQAVGILAARDQVDPDRSRRILVRAAEDLGMPVVAVADALVRTAWNPGDPGVAAVAEQIRQALNRAAAAVSAEPRTLVDLRSR